jgi:hypothetical protein
LKFGDMQIKLAIVEGGAMDLYQESERVNYKASKLCPDQLQMQYHDLSIKHDSVLHSYTIQHHLKCSITEQIEEN